MAERIPDAEHETIEKLLCYFFGEGWSGNWRNVKGRSTDRNQVDF